MDSQERHELKENDLLEFFRNFREWWQKYGTQLLLVILVCVLALTMYRYYSGKAHREADAAWNQYITIVTSESDEKADAFQHFARQNTNRQGLSNLAYLNAGDLLLEQATVGAGGLDGPPADQTEPTEDQRKKLDLAATYYQHVIDAPQPHEPSLYKLNARMGLAAVKEMLGDWDAAKAQYQAVIQESGTYRNIAGTADRLLKTIEQRMEPIVFRPTPDSPDFEGLLNLPDSLDSMNNDGTTIVLPQPDAPAGDGDGDADQGIDEDAGDDADMNDMP